MPKVWNKHHKNAPEDAVYVGRPSKWGNPFEIGKDGTREEVVEKFRLMLTHDDVFWSLKRWECRTELAGKHLVCWCAPKPCHADVLLEIANEEVGKYDQYDSRRLRDSETE